MKAKTKIIIALSLAGVITLGAVITLVGENGTTYDSSIYDDASYARIDGGPEAPGYFYRIPE